MKAGLRDPSLEALQNGLSAQTRPKSDRQRGRLAVTTSQIPIWSENIASNVVHVLSKYRFLTDEANICCYKPPSRGYIALTFLFLFHRNIKYHVAPEHASQRDLH